ncbi:pyruvate kinase [gamma proteobacterium BDW918]|jgi:pyruvate kinase|uniref:Pyruvate kinase n=1 Tax=Zhongshania aliphaticivorans TaxID=1470434 RepID=A0A127M7E9_9GAMM|nr:pyruvate kinase [Zhongshania aliphaticivorans]AMO69167.1 pyruvate kinase [Zhongshania aliphaticivorans]EIF43785.1 pyruvate kinase [gamma proteobacterium BDW918]
MIRRTKIVATLGPATDGEGVLEKLILAGANVVRLNFSHGCPADHRRRAEEVRALAKQHRRSVAVLGDLQGPKVRISRFSAGSVTLENGQIFTLDASLPSDGGSIDGVGLDYTSLPDEVVIGDRLLLDDGRIVLEVERKLGSKIITQVIVGGSLSNNKGINLEGGGLAASALTEKDFADILLAAEIDVDYLAVSFVRSPDDLHRARKALVDAGGKAGIVSKIERAEAVADLDLLDDIIRASDVVMVARGDLGVEIGDAALIGVQKYLIKRSRALQKVVITATQMMESMIDSPLPTRAEVFDVANAVLDGTDAVMLSGETAAGRFPVEAVAAMDRVILGAEKHPESRVSSHRLHENFVAADESVAMGAMYIANHMQGVTAIISLTETGNTPLLMTRIFSDIPVFAFTPNAKTESRVALYRNVIPISYQVADVPADKINESVVSELLRRGLVAERDWVILSKGDYNNVHGGTNTIKIVNVGDRLG